MYLTLLIGIIIIVIGMNEFLSIHDIYRHKHTQFK